jgi:arsenite/tail-anchored protein-transporting ATPase
MMKAASGKGMTEKGDKKMRRRHRAASPSPSLSASGPPKTSSPAILSSVRFLFFGGKGGVGKTTAASAAALHLLDRARGDERILLFSTDPAHSLSDSLGVEIGDRITEVARRGKAMLEAREMDSAAALERFKAKHLGALREIADRGTLLDETDIDELLDLSLPGLDEVMALFELSDLAREPRYARIVVDTAPSGHTSRLLRLPAVIANWAGALDRLSEKHRYMVAQLARASLRRDDEAELFLSELDEKIARSREMLYDPERAAFTLVTIPEAMSVEETSRYFDLLKQQSAPVTDLIINRIEQEHGDCKFCRARARSQKPLLKQIQNRFGALRFGCAPLFAQETRGPEALRRFAIQVWGENDRVSDDAAIDKAATDKPAIDKSATNEEVADEAAIDKLAADEEVADEAATNEGARYRESSNRKPPRVSIPEPLRRRATAATIESRKLLIFGGKGGVGKTTAAAASALALAKREAGARMLVFSTDPAHSLSDVFDESIGELKRAVAGQANLDAMEINPARWLEGLKQRYQSWADELFDSLTAGSRWEIQFDREAMRELIELAPPGIDEIAALSKISDLLDEGRYESIILDTAPTGHLIRFLELPAIALSWVRALIKLLLKYKGVARWEGLAEEFIALSKSIKRVAALLTDEKECEFIGVAIPERMSLQETIRLTETLKRLKVPMRRLLINNVAPARAAEACDFCAARRRAQARALEDFRRAFSDGIELLAAAEQPRDIRGPKLLAEHFARWQTL